MIIQIIIKILFNNKKNSWIVFYHLCEFFKTNIPILPLINDLGINKVPKENKNKNNTFQILENIILN
jgi:hypothetical protein